MNNHPVFMPGGEDRVETGFPRHYPLAAGSSWAVGSDELTCADVCARLGIGSGESGVV